MNSSSLIVDFKRFVNRIAAPNSAPMTAFATPDNREKLANRFRLLRCRLRADYEPAFVRTFGVLLNDDPWRAQLRFLEPWNRSPGFIGVGAFLALAVNGQSQRSNREFPIARSDRRTRFRRWRLPEGHTNLP